MSTAERDAIVNVRERWELEDRHFTPWLSKNLHQLGEVLNAELELIRTEEPVGPYYLDILAKETDTGVLVAIENQLDETDHSHLGQLLTYASGCDARIAIWIAPEFGYEHAAAMNRLNEWTGESISFYAIKVEVIKKAGGECLEPILRKVVYPGGWNKDITLKSGEMPQTIRRHYDFFQPLTTKLLGEGFADKAVQEFNHTDRFFPSRLNPGIGYAASFWKNSAWVTLHIRTEDNQRSNQIFDGLRKQQGQIEECLEADWLWQRWDNYTFSSINMRRDGSIDDPPERLEEIRAWMAEQLPKLKEVLDPHLERVLNELQSEGAGDGGPAP